MRTVTSASGFAAPLAISLLAFTTFVIVTTEFVVVGLLPPMAESLEVPLAKAGGFVTWFAVAAALLGPPMTMLAGRHDPRHFLVAAGIIFATGNFLIALAPHYSVVIGIRLLQGSTLPAAISVIAVAAVRLAGAERQGWAISHLNFGVVAATVFGVPAGAVVADKVGWSVSFAGLAVLGLVSVGLIAVWFPRTKTENQPSMLTAASLLWQPAFLMHLLLACLLFTGMFAGYTYIGALFGILDVFNGETIGWALMGFGLAGAFGNWIAGRVVDRDPLVATVCVASALTFAMAVVVPVGELFPSCIGLVIGLWGAAHMAAFVITQVRVMKAGREAAAFALSLNLSVCNLGIALGATLGGQIEIRYGIGTVGYFGAAGSSIALLLALIMIAARSAGRRRHERKGFPS